MNNDFKVWEKAEIAFNSIKKKINSRIETGIILGSGLASIADSFAGIEIPFCKIKGFPNSGVQGHKSILKISGKTAIFCGRFHYYEGYDSKNVVLPIYVLKKLGASKIIVTNASGGINSGFKSGDIVLIKDHINLTGTNPLIGKNNPDLGPRFPDMSDAYSDELINKALIISKELFHKKFDSGVYAGLTGPSYETPAEIRMLRTLGADMVGMSTVFEVITANYLGLKTLGISCITNMAAGISKTKLNHKEVIEAGKLIEEKLKKFIIELTNRL